MLVALSGCGAGGDELRAKRSHDFGYVLPGVVVNHTFQLTNATEKTLSIANVITICGCTDAAISPRVVPRGETAELAVSIRVSGREADDRQRIVVQFGETHRKPVEFELLAHVRNRMSISPTAVVLSPATRHGVLRLGRATLSNFSERAWSSVKISPSEDWLKCAIQNIPTVRDSSGPRQKWIIDLSAMPPDVSQIRSTLHQLVRIEAVLENETVAVNLPVTLPLTPALQSFPSTIFVNRLEPGAECSATLKIVANDGVSVESVVEAVCEVQCALPIQYRWVRGGDNFVLLLLTVLPDAGVDFGKVNGKLVFRNAKWIFKEWEIPIKGFVR